MKKFYPVFIAIVLISASCVHISGYDEYRVVKNKAIIDSCSEAFNKHDFKLMASFYADTARFLDPALGKEFVRQSPEQTIAKYTAMVKTFPDLKDSATSVMANEDQVVTQFIATGTAADGKPFSLPGCSVYKLKGGKIISDASYYDTKGQ